MNQSFTPEQDQAIDQLEAMRFDRQADIAAKSCIGPIAVQHALAPLRELIDATMDAGYPEAHALATAMGGRDANDFTVRELLWLIAGSPT